MSTYRLFAIFIIPMFLIHFLAYSINTPIAYSEEIITPYTPETVESEPIVKPTEKSDNILLKVLGGIAVAGVIYLLMLKDQPPPPPPSDTGAITVNW